MCSPCHNHRNIENLIPHAVTSSAIPPHGFSNWPHCWTARELLARVWVLSLIVFSMAAAAINRSVGLCWALLAPAWYFTQEENRILLPLGHHCVIVCLSAFVAGMMDYTGNWLRKPVGNNEQIIRKLFLKMDERSVVWCMSSFLEHKSHQVC